RWIVPDPALRRPFRCRLQPEVGASGPERQPGTRARERGYPQEVAGYVKAGSGPRGKIAEDRVGGGTAATESVITDGRLPSRQSSNELKGERHQLSRRMRESWCRNPFNSIADCLEGSLPPV